MPPSKTPPPPPPGRLPVGSKCVAASQQACALVGALYGTKYACVSCHAVFGKWGGYQKHVGGAPLTMIVAGVAADGSQIFGTGVGGAPPTMAVPGCAKAVAGAVVAVVVLVVMVALVVLLLLPPSHPSCLGQC